MRRLALLGAAVAAWRTEGLPVELPLAQKEPGGPFVARVAVGTPPQHLWLRVDSGSQWTYIPDARGFATAGFSTENSSTAEVGIEKSITFVDGSSINGNLLHDDVELGGVRAAHVPLMLVRNVTPPGSPEHVGLLGLINLRTADFGAAAWPFSGDMPQLRQPLQRGLLQYFWEQHPEVPQTLRLEFGGPAPQLLVGAEVAEKPRAEGGVQFLSTIFTSRSSQWFASIRALGLSKGKASPALHWNLDFNALVPYGAPARFDSGVSSIRLGSVVYGRFLVGLPRDCQSAAAKYEGTTCPCTPGSIEEDFPSISISFEAAETFRFLGLDSGADVIVCIPPQAYVSYDEHLKQCLVAVSDAGPHHVKFGFEKVILGLPLFRSTAVVFDAEHRRLGMGPPLAVAPAPAPSPTSHWDPNRRPAAGAIEQVDPQAKCLCADPKNWWSTGKRFSPKRVLVVLVGVTALVAYIFVAHSPSATAEGLRDMAESFCGASRERGHAPAPVRFVAAGSGLDPAGTSNGAPEPSGRIGSGRGRRGAATAAAAAAERRLSDNSVDRPLIQMADRSEHP